MLPSYVYQKVRFGHSRQVVHFAIVLSNFGKRKTGKIDKNRPRLERALEHGLVC